MDSKKTNARAGGESDGSLNTGFHIEAVPVALSLLSPAAIGSLLDKCKVVEQIIKRVRHEARELLKSNPASIPGWTVGDPANVRSISDPFGAYKVLSEAALLTRDQFMADCISVGIGDLEKALAKHNGLKPAKAKETVNSICAPFITTYPKDGSLEKL